MTEADIRLFMTLIRFDEARSAVLDALLNTLYAEPDLLFTAYEGRTGAGARRTPRSPSDHAGRDTQLGGLTSPADLLQVYVVYFKTNRNFIKEFPNMSSYVKDLYSNPGRRSVTAWSLCTLSALPVAQSLMAITVAYLSVFCELWCPLMNPPMVRPWNLANRP